MAARLPSQRKAHTSLPFFQKDLQHSCAPACPWDEVNLGTKMIRQTTCNHSKQSNSIPFYDRFCAEGSTCTLLYIQQGHGARSNTPIIYNSIIQIAIRFAHPCLYPHDASAFTAAWPLLNGTPPQPSSTDQRQYQQNASLCTYETTS